MTKSLANYLGRPVYTMLEDAPFKNWPVQKSFDEDSHAEPAFGYVFPHHGRSLRCDSDGMIGVIFLYSDLYNGLDETLLDAPFSSNRQQVIARLGQPSKSGGPRTDPVLGEYGPWDRFARPGHTTHVEYRADSDRIRMITLMRDGWLPSAS
jgi:hypothetical protein